MIKISIDQDKCNQCGACVALCSNASFVNPVFEQVNQKIKVLSSDGCWCCGHCIAICPTDAIIHSEFPLSSCPVLDQGTLPSAEGLVTAFRNRRSARIFRNKSVSFETVSSLVDISRWVPSGGNLQPINWIAIDEPEQISTLREGVIEVLRDKHKRYKKGNAPDVRESDFNEFEEVLKQFDAGGRDPIFYNAPVLLLAHGPKDNAFGRDDATYAAYNLMLVAETMGLGTCLMGYLMEVLTANESFATKISLPDDRRVEVALILGYQKYRFRRFVSRRKMELAWNPISVN
ncbi:MAG: nitroreductase family protein [Desulfobacterales bacterium]|nr:nitroreductase family protein [Desulfobacterales bacterium]